MTDVTTAHRLAASVIIPHLNTGDALQRCLQSVLEQHSDHGEFEVIVVDNGSSAPPHWIEDLPRVRLVIETIPGPGPARNAGAAIARGETLVFIDADCCAAPGWLEAVITEFSRSDGTQIIGGEISVAPAADAQWTPVGVFEAVFSYRQVRNVQTRSFVATANMAVRATAFEIVGPFVGIDFPEDLEWCNRAVELGFRIDYRAAMLVNHAARSTFRDLALKWRRHVHQERQLHLKYDKSSIAWLVRAGLVLLSTPLAVPRLLFAPGPHSVVRKLGAVPVLFGIRLLRFREMVRLSFRSAPRPPWNLA